MSRLVEVITSDNPAVRNRSLDSLCTGMNTAELLVEAAALERSVARPTTFMSVYAHFFFSTRCTGSTSAGGSRTTHAHRFPSPDMSIS